MVPPAKAMPLALGLALVLSLSHLSLTAGAGAEYDEDGDPELYAWRTRGHHVHSGSGRNSTNFNTANANDSEKITVHLVPHAHLDVGWLKTVEECWYGANQSIQDASVEDIIDSVVGQLALNPDRKWTIGEQAFFQRFVSMGFLWCGDTGWEEIYLGPVDRSHLAMAMQKERKNE